MKKQKKSVSNTVDTNNSVCSNSLDSSNTISNDPFLLTNSTINKNKNILHHNFLAPEEQDLAVIEKMNDLYSAVYTDQGQYKELTDDELSRIIFDEEVLNFCHRVLELTVKYPEHYALVNIDDVSFTLETSKATWQRMKEKHHKLNEHAPHKFIQRPATILSNLYRSEMVFQFESGGEIVFNYDPVYRSEDEIKDVNANDIRSSRISFRFSSLESNERSLFVDQVKSLELFIDWLNHYSKREYELEFVKSHEDICGQHEGHYLTRVDPELWLVGIPFPLLFVQSEVKNLKHHEVIFGKVSNEELAVANTEYLGQKEDSSHHLAYDPILKLLDKGELSLLQARVFPLASKIERRVIPRHENKSVLVNEMLNEKQVRHRFHELVFYSPLILLQLPRPLASKVVRYKLNEVWNYLGTRETRQLEKVLELPHNRFQFDANAIQFEVSKKLNKLLDALMPSRNRPRFDMRNSKCAKRRIPRIVLNKRKLHSKIIRAAKLVKKS